MSVRGVCCAQRYKPSCKRTEPTSRGSSADRQSHPRVIAVTAFSFLVRPGFGMHPDPPPRPRLVEDEKIVGAPARLAIMCATSAILTMAHGHQVRKSTWLQPAHGRQSPDMHIDVSSTIPGVDAIASASDQTVKGSAYRGTAPVFVGEDSAIELYSPLACAWFTSLANSEVDTGRSWSVPFRSAAPLQS